MEKILKETLKEIRNYCIEKYNVNSALELNLYHHIEFTDEVERYFSDKDEFDKICVVSTYNLFKTNDNGEIVEDEFDENLILHHNKNELPSGLTIDLLNKIGPSHSWINYNNLYYDAECLEGVDKLFDLPYYQRIIKE